MADTRQCPNCGTANPVGNALCSNCHTPFTAYAGQITGERYQGKLAGQVSDLETRPPGVIGMAVFNVLLALFWPLWRVIAAFAAKQTTNAEGTNYLQSAFGTIGPMLLAAFLIPVAIALGILAWATWTQRTWTWNVNAVVLGIFGVVALFQFPAAHAVACLKLAVVVVLGFLWFQAKTKAWFGLS